VKEKEMLLRRLLLLTALLMISRREITWLQLCPETTAVGFEILLIVLFIDFIGKKL
jgi:hypothetical protein